MLRFEIPSIEDAGLISRLAVQTFYESHGHSASKKDLEEYEHTRLSPDLIKRELTDAKNDFRIAYYDGMPVGFSKLVYDAPNSKINETPVCELNKIYVLKEHYGKKIGKPLFDLNVELAKQKKQKGMWLYVWTENKRALRFYEKQGFKIIADALFRVSETHSNPNYWMYLKF